MTCFPSSTNSAQSVATSGRWRRFSPALLASCALASGSVAADSITQADADRIATAISEQMTSVLTSMPVSFGPTDGVISQPMTVPNGMPLGIFLARVLGWDEVGNMAPPEKPIVQLLAELDTYFQQYRTDWDARSHQVQYSLDVLESLLTDIEIDANGTKSNTDGLWDQLSAIVGFSEDIANLLRRPAAQHIGYQTENLNGELALSVHDADTASALESLQDALQDGLDGLGNALDGLTASFSSNVTVSVVALSPEAGEQVADSIASKADSRYEQLRESNEPPNTTEDMFDAEHSGQSTANESDAGLTSYSGNDYPLPTYEPDTSGLNLNADLVPRATIPNLSPVSQDVTVFDGMDVNRMPGWQGLAVPIKWTPWNRAGTSRVTALFEQAGRVMSGVWEIAFAVWLFLLVRREVLFYMTLGQDDASRSINPGDVAGL